MGALRKSVIISLVSIFSVCLLFSMVPVLTHAATYKNFQYNITSEGTVTISKYQGSDKDVVVPYYIEGYPVTRIAGMAFIYKSMNSIELPASIEKLDQLAFFGSNIGDVLFTGNLDQWIFIEKNNSYIDVNSSNIYVDCTPTEPVVAPIRGNELDFQRDVWGFKNYTDSRCYLEDETTSGQYHNPYIRKLKPVSREAVQYSMQNGSKGHCFGMSATVILQKLGIEDLTQWSGADFLRQLDGNGIERNRICYYHSMQVLMDFTNEVQRFQDYSVAEQLQILANKSDQVKTGGNPILLCFGKDGWGAHAIVAYALEPGSFVSSVTDKTYDHRILCYDCNAVDWNPDACLLFNEGTGEWEIPRYADDGVISSEGAYLMCAADDLSSFDAIDDYEQKYDTGICPVVNVKNTEELIIEDNNTGEQWTVNVEQGKVTGSTELFSYHDQEILDQSEGTAALNIVLPNIGSTYTIKTAYGNTDCLAVNVLYEDKYLAIQSDAAKGSVISSEGTASIIGNEGNFQITVADNNLEQEGKFDTFTLSGTGKGNATLEVKDQGVKIAGDQIAGDVIEGSDGIESEEVVVSNNQSTIYDNDKEQFINEGILLGDVNGDGEVDVRDQTVLAKHVARIAYITDSKLLKSADVSGDGIVDAMDLTRLAKFVAKIIPEL